MKIYWFVFTSLTFSSSTASCKAVESGKEDGKSKNGLILDYSKYFPDIIFDEVTFEAYLYKTSHSTSTRFPTMGKTHLNMNNRRFLVH